MDLTDIVNHLVDCECGNQIWANNVYKTIGLPQANNLLALIYKCPSCGKDDKLAASLQEWEAAKKAAVTHSKYVSRMLHEAHIEVEGFDTVDELLSFWQSLHSPPLIEKVLGKCPCDQCRRKLYG